MDRVPESPATTAELLRWIAYERDAAWTAKLAILRARRREDIAHFGACLREHDRHAGELALLARLTDPAAEVGRSCASGSARSRGSTSKDSSLSSSPSRP
jgi:hypothetical protein